MSKITSIGLDLAKSVFQVHGSDEHGRPVLRKKLRRGQVVRFFETLVPAHSKQHRNDPSSHGNGGCFAVCP